VRGTGRACKNFLHFPSQSVPKKFEEQGENSPERRPSFGTKNALFEGAMEGEGRKSSQIFRFCYNRRVRKIPSWLLAGVLFFSVVCFSAEKQSIQDFVSEMQKSLESHDLESYLKNFAPELQDTERQEQSMFFDSLKMETMTLYWANKGSFDQEKPKIFLQVIVENSYSALVETWELALDDADGRWRIKEKKTKGGISQLFKIRIPSERMERVKSIEVRHVDITLKFQDALVFYDNIPDLDTALLVMGEGRISFSPSDSNEKHQLELIYGNTALEDIVDHAYFRFSNSFFNENITITRTPGDPTNPVTPAERAKAASLFRKYHLDYFAIQSPLTPGPLSFLPQANAAAIEFNGNKGGDLTYVYSPFANEEVTLFERSRNRFISLYSPLSENENRRMVITFGQKFDVQDYQIELDYEPQSYYLSAKASIRIQAQMDNLDSIKLKFNPSLEILRIYDQEKRDLLFTQDKAGKILYVYFFEPVPKNTSAAVEILYRGKLEPPPPVVDALPGSPAGDLLVYVPPRYETYLFSQVAYWYPSPPDEDYFTARLKIIVPPDYSSVASGRLLEEGTINGIQRVTEFDKMGSVFSVFETKYPVKYLSFLVGKLSLTEERTGPPLLSTYVASDVHWLKRNFLEETQRILKFYESRFGPFPYETLRIIQRLWPNAGGYSPATFVVLNELPRSLDDRAQANLVMDKSNPVDLAQWKEYFLAHEIAHQWWGQGVTWATYRDQWLSEGLSQFSAALYLQSEHKAGTYSSILKKFSKWAEKKTQWGPITLGSRLSYFDFEAYQTIVYDKSSLVLNMLRDLLGDEPFFAGLQEFFRRFKYSAATTGQFKKVMEEISRRDLDNFFSGWFNTYFLPEARLTYLVQKKEAGDFLKVRVEQGQNVFVFPLWLEWSEKTGGAVHREKLIIEKRIQEFEIPLSAQVEKVRINPDKAVPGKLTLAKG